jgi:predicted O-methyltransferase YrrM
MIRRLFRSPPAQTPVSTPEERAAWAKPAYGKDAARCEAVCYSASAGETEWYPPVMAGAETFSLACASADTLQDALAVMGKLSPDDYTRYLTRFYTEGLNRFGDGWIYADIVTVLLTMSRALKPARYLEIGVRRGRSVCTVASQTPSVDVVLFDMWMKNYAGMDNPGPDFVRGELKKVGHTGKAEFIDGNSHVTVKKYFAENPNTYFDLITVDGDHTDPGAAEDLADVLPHLAVGGAVVFDDVSHPAHPGLAEVWRTQVANDPRFSAWTFADAGYGVGFALRKH